MGKSQRPSEGNKKIYATLAQAIRAKSGVARSRGERWKRQLRIYRYKGGWCLTKASKSDYEYNAHD
jgi:hypothetical protein